MKKCRACDKTEDEQFAEIGAHFHGPNGLCNSCNNAARGPAREFLDQWIEAVRVIRAEAARGHFPPLSFEITVRVEVWKPEEKKETSDAQKK